eukprot:Polyplicarium_translucidae@DN2670_c0_g1_i1.p1
MHADGEELRSREAATMAAACALCAPSLPLATMLVDALRDQSGDADPTESEEGDYEELNEPNYLLRYRKDPKRSRLRMTTRGPTVYWPRKRKTRHFRIRNRANCAPSQQRRNALADAATRTSTLTARIPPTMPLRKSHGAISYFNEDGAESLSQAALAEFLESPKFHDGLVDSEATAREMAKFLQSRGVRVVAVDLDQTLSMIHTQGHVPVDPENEKNVAALSSLSPDFTALANACTPLGVDIAVVTFSDVGSCEEGEMGGEELSRAIVGDAFPVREVYPYYPKLYREEIFYPQIRRMGPLEPFKTYHLRRLCEDFGIMPRQVLFVDDARVNCVQGVTEGYPTAWVSKKGFTFDALKGSF